tara:strand:- start:619 stop:777 length:159 start_codon:yes stop_codon:yes gene_type:complete
MEYLKGKKTYIVAVIAVLTAIASYLTGDLTIPQAGQAILTAVLGATLRHGIS